MRAHNDRSTVDHRHTYKSYSPDFDLNCCLHRGRTFTSTTGDKTALTSTIKSKHPCLLDELTVRRPKQPPWLGTHNMIPLVHVEVLVSG